MSENKSENQECPIKTPSTIIDSFNAMLGFVPIPHPPVCDNLYAGFLLPIEYLEKSQQRTVAKNVADDLELIQTVDVSGSSSSSSSPSSTSQQKSMYEWFAEPSNDFGKMLIPEMAIRYTTNVGFLEDTQKVIERMSEKMPVSLDVSKTSKFIEIWNIILNNN